MKVYALETGCYENAWVVGIFATPEAAMAAHSPKKPKNARKGHSYFDRANEEWSYKWKGPDKDGNCGFDADWDDAASVRAYEVEE